MLDKHGLKMIGIKAAARETQDYGRSGCFVEIHYNRRTGQIHYKTLCGSTYTVYDDADVIVVRSHATQKMTMQEIADAILEAVKWDDNRRKMVAEWQSIS